jgi:hypothetical protein
MFLEEQAVFNRERNKYGVGQRGLEFMYGVVRNASFAGSPAHEAEDRLGAPGVHERQLMRSRGLIWKNEYAVRIVMNVTDTISLDQKQPKKEEYIYIPLLTPSR